MAELCSCAKHIFNTFFNEKISNIKKMKKKTTYSIILNGLMQAYSWEYCMDIGKHYYTPKLGRSEYN